MTRRHRHGPIQNQSLQNRARRAVNEWSCAHGAWIVLPACGFHAITGWKHCATLCFNAGVVVTQQLELLLEPFQDARLVDVNTVDRQAQLSGHFARGLPFDPREFKTAPGFWFKTVANAFTSNCENAFDKTCVPGRVLVGAVGERFDPVHADFFGPLISPNLISKLVGGHRRQPGAESPLFGLIVKAANRTGDGNQNFLANIVYVGTLKSASSAEGLNDRPVDFLESLP